ncbi:Hsp70 family protein [Bordetella sp. 2513F-2]
MSSPVYARACGIDFGTSNSAVGWYRPGLPTLLPLEDGHPTMPSAVFFHEEDTTVSVGRAALEDYLAGYEGRLMRAMKNLLGSSLIDGHTEIRGRGVPFRVLLAHFIGQLKARAEQAAGRAFTSVVMGRPAFFVDGDEAADRTAQDTLGEIAAAVGFEHVAFQYEPLAAAFDYESQISREELVLVIDIGGGTSDFSLIRLGPQRAGKPDRREDILAHGGVHIGGGDFDRQLNLAAFMPLLGLGSKLRSGKDVPSTPYSNLASWHTINFAYTSKAQETLSYIRANAVERDKVALLLRLVEQRAGHWLSLQVEKAKIALSDAPATEASLDRIAPGRTLAISRPDLDQATAPLIDRIESTVAALLKDAAVGAGAVDTVFFTGGSSRVSCLRERIGALLPGARNVEGDLFGSIGTGLALDAARKFGSGSAASGL